MHALCHVWYGIKMRTHAPNSDNAFYCVCVFDIQTRDANARMHMRIQSQSRHSMRTHACTHARLSRRIARAHTLSPDLARRFHPLATLITIQT